MGMTNNCEVALNRLHELLEPTTDHVFRFASRFTSRAGCGLSFRALERECVRSLQGHL
jgi:hypothetical protein